MKRSLISLSLTLGLALGLTGSAVADPTGQATGTPAAQQLQAQDKPAKELSAKQIAANVQQFYDKTKTFKAGFEQRYWIKLHNKVKKSNGSVVFEKPGKMSWRYKNNGNRVVSNGDIIKVYEAENKQMYEQKVDKSQYPAALAFLSGAGDLRKEFKLRKVSSERLKFEGGHVLLGKPRKKTPAYKKVLFYVDAETSQVRRVMLIDAQGNRNRFDFVKPAVNTKTDASEFNFEPPPGTKVVKP